MALRLRGKGRVLSTLLIVVLIVVVQFQGGASDGDSGGEGGVEHVEEGGGTYGSAGELCGDLQ
jgi:hypothetical protein